MPAVPGFKTALKEYESDKVKDRVSGGEKLREIFGNRENLLAFQESASRSGGEGWSALFHSLFHAVNVEKKAVIKTNATAQADRRLADAVSLVRWIAERSVHFLSRKPLLVLVRHMIALLVHSSNIFPPTVRDYAKALRTLLSYPPHLDNLEESDWTNLMSLCWAGALGDRVPKDEQWGDESYDELDEDQEMGDVDDGMLGSSSTGHTKGKAAPAVNQMNTELINLIPILLSSPSASLVPAMPTVDGGEVPPSIGYRLLQKVVRFLEQRPTETSVHLPILRSCNIVLIELELNARDELVRAGTKLLPSLVGLWATKNKALREQVLIALRLLLPWLCHETVEERMKEVVQGELSRLADAVGKESTLRWGIAPLDLQSLRIAPEVGEAAEAFRLGVIRPGFDFSHEMAFAWTVQELYADIIVYLYSNSITVKVEPSMEASTSRSSKRRKLEDPLTTLLNSVQSGTPINRLLNLQILTFILSNHPTSIQISDQALIRSAALDCMEADDETLQSWSFICLAFIESTFGLGLDSSKVWSAATRKIVIPAISRGAAFCSTTLLSSTSIETDIITRDIGQLLRQIDVQGPSHPHDSICQFLSAIMELAQSDVRVYSQNLEDKVLAWMSRQDLVDGPRGRSRMDARIGTDVIRLLCVVGGLTPPVILEPSDLAYLPECPIVERVLEELKVRPVRRFVLFGEFPQVDKHKSTPSSSKIPARAASLPVLSSDNAQSETLGGEAFLTDRPRRLSDWLRGQISRDLLEWRSQGPTSKSSERVRKSLDLGVLVILFQNTLHINGITTDQDCLLLVKDLLIFLQPELAIAGQITTQLFLWQAFQPILPSPASPPKVWPITLRAEKASGIRSDLLPPHEQVDVGEETRIRRNEQLVSAWKLPEVNEALQQLVAGARKLSDTKEAAQVSIAAGPTQYTQHVANDDDDFGEIRIAETDAMPVSKEALDSQRSAILLLRQIITFRLTGAKNLSQSTNPPKDANLLNALLNAEGIHMLQLGQVISDAVANEQLRLTPEAVELVVDLLEEGLSSYAYSRDEGQYLLVLSFLHCAAPIWLAPQMAESQIAERIITIVQHIAAKLKAGQLKSWRVRLQVVLFLDDYLEYEPDWPLWTAYEAEAEDIEEMGPMAVIERTLTDRDMRVRARAATSSAGVFYLPHLPSSSHVDHYINIMNKQPRRVNAWNPFLTDILWKLNCGITSGACRSIVLFHLYEIPFASSGHNTHLQNGLTTVARRLGLATSKDLWVEHLPVVCPALISSKHLTLYLRPSLSGYEAIKDRAVSELAVMAPALLAATNLRYFGDVCEAAGTSVNEQALRHLYATTAIFLGRIIHQTPSASAKQIKKRLIDGISSIPCDNTIDPEAMLGKAGVAIAVELFGLLRASDSIVAVGAMLRKVKGANAELLQLSPTDMAAFTTYNIQDRVESVVIIQALIFLETISPLDRQAACFNSLLHIFGTIDKVCLVGEQALILSQVVLVLATFANTLHDGRILQLLILECVALLDRPDICLVAFRIVVWGFAQIDISDGQMSRMTDIIARLGRVRQRANDEMASLLDNWVESQASSWLASSIISASINQAAVLWPEEMRRRLGILADPTFAEVADLVVAGIPGDSMIICEKLSDMIQSGETVEDNKRIFTEQSFWHIKDSFTEETWTPEGALAFVKALAAVDGQVHTADKNVYGEDDKISQVQASHLAKDPVLLSRSLLVQHLMRAVDREDRPSRVTAYLILRQLRNTIDDMLVRRTIPRAMIKEIELLRSPFPNELIIASIYTVDHLADDVLSSIDNPDVWLRELSIRLCDIAARSHPFFSRLRAFVLSPSADLASLLPLLVQSFLSTCDPKQPKEISLRQKSLERVFLKALQNPLTSSIVIHAIINTILHLRSYKPIYRPDSLGYNHWLNIDKIVLAEAAVQVGSFATAQVFLEIEKGELGEIELDLFDSRLQKIMLAVYSNVNDPDGFYGVKINNVKDSLRLRLNHEGEHFRAFGLHGADLEAAAYGSVSTSDLMASARDLHAGGLHRTALSITQSIRTQSDQASTADDLLFEIAWRTGDWDLPVPVAGKTSSAGSFYSALRSLHRSRDEESMRKSVNGAMKSEMMRLKELGSERMLEIQKAVDNLVSLREVSQWLGPSVQRAISEGDFKNAALREFSQIGSSARYLLAERLHATRMSILTSVHSRESKNLLGDMSSPLGDAVRDLQLHGQLNFSGYARAEGHVQTAINAITAVQQLEGPNLSSATGDEYGEVLWMQDEHSLALQLAEGMKMGLDMKVNGSGGRSGILTSRIAIWSYRAKLLPVKDVHDMFNEAYQTLTRNKAGEKEIAQSSHDYAIFAAEQQAMQRNSPETTALRDYRDRRIQSIKDLSKPVKEAVGPRASISSVNAETSVQNREELKQHAEKALEQDEAAVKDADDRVDTLTKMALKMFAHALRYSDDYDDSIIKMCSIWLGHCDPKACDNSPAASRAESVARHCTSSINDIPSRKFIVIGGQLAARLYTSGRSKEASSFNRDLNDTVRRVSRDHPYHVLYHIIPLAHGYKTATKAKKGAPVVVVDDGRAAAATAILTNMRGDPHSEIIRSAATDMAKFAEAAMAWCLTTPLRKDDPRADGDIPLPSDNPLRKLSRGLAIPIATCIPPISADLSYAKVPKLKNYTETYRILGGVHRPYRVRAIDTSGGRHDQLFKGHDEVRQDAVMEQVFGMANKMLREDRQTKRRNLRYRTYVVIPFAKETGVLEFVAGGQSIGEWLKPAHKKYRTGIDVEDGDFRRVIGPLQNTKPGVPPDNVKILAHYKKLIPRFRPVMRHFFTEKHKDPMGWFAMRLRYSRSVAVTSMVGYILGIGDRHLSNIMIDGQTGELVHIDFGIVFEKGIEQRIPEKVPFRFTNDIVDGLGITGAEGTFRRCSEQTIRVLRANSDLILTVLEVFKQDPLNMWEPDIEKWQREQARGAGAHVELNKSTSVLEKADRVLRSVRLKLTEALSAEYTVNKLVQEARDVENLATIFHGWHPWF